MFFLSFLNSDCNITAFYLIIGVLSYVLGIKSFR